MSDLFRDSTVGLIINTITNGRILPYADQDPRWEVPQHLQSGSPASSVSDGKKKEVAPEATQRPPDDVEQGLPRYSSFTDNSLPPPEGSDSDHSTPPSLKKDEAKVSVRKDVSPSQEPAHVLVEWYDENDQDNPQNWSLRKKIVVLALISFLTFSVYIGSAIYTPSIPGVIEKFHVNQTTATLGLSLYVIGYGIGPIIFSPLSELPLIGRTPIYIVTLLIFVVLQIPTIYARNIHTLLAMRFLAGFFGSPALATGGASIQDMFSMIKLPYALIMWSVAAVCGPVLGPVIGGFAAQNRDWRWPLFELLWLSSFAFIVLVFWLPETNGETILYRRAYRLRKRTGNMALHSESMVKQSQMKGSQILTEALIRPFQLMLEPAVFYANLYLALAYAIFYLWFEAFPIVYVGMYNFNLGESGLPFLGLFVTCVLTSAAYICWQRFHVEPQFKKQGFLKPESRLAVALVASVFIPISLFMFGWTARPSIHWIVPTIGAALYLPGLYLLFQSILVYLPLSYPRYAASVLAGNDLFRSVVAGAFPLFGHALYTHLTVAGGCSLLAGLSIALIPGLVILYVYGDKIRARSKYAQA